MSRQDIQDIAQLRVTLSRRLQKLKEQKATYGIDTPPHILLEIENIETEIEQLGLKLKEKDDAAEISSHIPPKKIESGKGIVWLRQVWWVPIVVSLIGLGGVIIPLVIKQGDTSAPTTPSPLQTFQYSIHVQAKETNEDIPNARVVIEIAGQVPLDDITDTNGFARVFISSDRVGQPARLIVQATGYKRYTQSIDLTKGNLPDLIPLESISSPLPSNQESENSPSKNATVLTPTTTVLLPDKLLFRSIPAEGAPCLEVNALAGNGPDVVWAGTNDGVWQSADGEMLRPFPNSGANLAKNSIFALYHDKYGNLWAGATDGLWLFHVGQWRAIPEFANIQVVALAEDASQPQARLWVGTYGGEVIGLNYTSASQDAINSNVFYRDTVITGSNTSVMGLVVDGEGRVWVGSFGKGVGIYDLTQWRWHTYATHRLPGNNITALAVGRKGQIWAGTYGGGYAYWDPTIGRWSEILYTEFSDPVRAFAFGPTPLVWIASYQSGITGYLDNLTKFYEADSIGLGNTLCPMTEIRTLYQTSAQGLLWLGGVNGLWQGEIQTN